MTTSTNRYQVPAAVRVGANAAMGIAAAALVAAVYYPAGPSSYVVLVPAAVVGVTMVVFGVAPALRVPTATHLIIAALLAALAVSVVVKWHVERRRIAQLTTAVEARAAGR